LAISYRKDFLFSDPGAPALRKLGKTTPQQPEENDELRDRRSGARGGA
jgi:hypothetical protein